MPVAYQNQWPAVTIQNLTANGGANGLVSVPSTDGFYVLQTVRLANSTPKTEDFQVLEVIGPTQMYLGAIKQVDQRYKAQGANLSAYTTALSATITAVQQNKKLPTPNAVLQAVLEAEPISALRQLQVNPRGQSLYDRGTLTTLRTSQILTNAYVATNTLDCSKANAVIVLTDFTNGSLTNAMLRFDVSDDASTWYPAESIDNGAATVAADEAQVDQFAKVHVLTVGAPTPYTNIIRAEYGGALAPYFRARILGTGTLTSSLADIKAYACIL